MPTCAERTLARVSPTIYFIPVWSDEANFLHFLSSVRTRISQDNGPKCIYQDPDTEKKRNSFLIYACASYCDMSKCHKKGQCELYRVFMGRTFALLWSFNSITALRKDLFSNHLSDDLHLKLHVKCWKQNFWNQSVALVLKDSLDIEWLMQITAKLHKSRKTQHQRCKILGNVKR